MEASRPQKTLGAQDGEKAVLENLGLTAQKERHGGRHRGHRPSLHTYTTSKTRPSLKGWIGGGVTGDPKTLQLPAANKHGRPGLLPCSHPNTLLASIMHFHDSKCVSNHCLWKFTPRMTKCTAQPALIRWGKKMTKWDYPFLPSEGWAQGQPQLGTCRNWWEAQGGAQAEPPEPKTASGGRGRGKSSTWRGPVVPR